MKTRFIQAAVLASLIIAPLASAQASYSNAGNAAVRAAVTDARDSVQRDQERLRQLRFTARQYTR